MKNQVIKFDQILLGFIVTSMNHSKGIANVTMVIDACDGSPVTSHNYRNVKVSPLLNWRFNYRPEKYIIGKLYKSGVYSPVFWDNPIQMIRYIDKVTGNLERKIALVTERSAEKTITKVMGMDLVSYRERVHSKKYFCRLSDRVRKEDLKSFSKQLLESKIS